MLGVLAALPALCGGYTTYIVAGGSQDFVRTYAEKTYGIPPGARVGSAGGTEYRLRQGRQAVPDQRIENFC